MPAFACSVVLFSDAHDGARPPHRKLNFEHIFEFTASVLLLCTPSFLNYSLLKDKKSS
jgi:hypothetical protein